MNRLPFLIGVVFVLAGIAVVLAVRPGAGKLGAERRAFDYDRSNMTLHAARAFDDFALYYVGSAFRGLPLTSIARRDHGFPTELTSLRANYVSFKYGSCTPQPGSGCPAPLEIQVWPACELHYGSYQLTPDPDGPGPRRPRPYPHKKAVVRGVPAKFFEGGAHLELYTGVVTIAIFGQSRDQVVAAAQQIRSLRERVAPGAVLPAPAPRALAGTLRC